MGELHPTRGGGDVGSDYVCLFHSSFYLSILKRKVWCDLQDALKAKQATGAEDTAAGVYHFVYMHELPKVDENLRDGVSPIPVSPPAASSGHYPRTWFSVVRNSTDDIISVPAGSSETVEGIPPPR